ncbi:MAG TPA: carboxypeptidase regulatory-like domain-containing protein [Candidatus Acidoferrum sp.]|nr:carboxypeptidase regulatory-like domain-containing protein [Candidatus Acidoferrum sp.]
MSSTWRVSRPLVATMAIIAAVSIGIGLNLTLAPVVQAQAGLSTGSIQGTILDPKGSSVPAAKVSITSKATGAKLQAEMSPSGTYNSGPLAPGEYLVRVEASGFNTVELPATVQVGNITTSSVALEVGTTTTVITVESAAITLNTEQSTIQGVVTQQQIENLPINGRNFLDLAQLEPGVQIQDGGNFDPTKKGFSSISFGGRFGRTARIEVDGLDISDETVGTTTQNIPINSIKEFQVSQSSLDLATELTSSGTVNIATRSGANDIHGQTFFYYRGDATSAKIGNPAAVFDRKQYGASLGGAFKKDKLFYFGSFERTKQALLTSVTFDSTTPFQALSGTYNAPFTDTQYLGRLDYQLNANFHIFYKFAYEQNGNVAAFVPNTFEPFANVDNTPSHAIGADFTTGSFSHQVRFGYLKFRNGIVDAVSGTNIVNPAPNLTLVIGNGRTSCTASGNVFCSGPNILAPQKTFQSNKQLKYDGSKIYHSHILRYGVGYNKILGGGFANFFGIAPAVRASFTTGSTGTVTQAASGPFPGGSGNPLNYPAHRIDVGNGEGCFTEIPQFGSPCGGQFDSRFQAYFGDSWKARPNFTISAGIRYNRDTGRSDSDLPAVAALNRFQAGLGDPVHQPNKNIGGSLGFAWDPWKNGKTIIRAGSGIYYENGVFNNILFDRPGRLPTGLFNQVQEVCTQGGVTLPDGTFVTSINGKNIPTQICEQPIGSVANDIAALQTQYQQATKAAGPQANGAYFGNPSTLTTLNTGSMFAPNFRSPYSVQINAGVQRELKAGTVLSMDYVRNVGLHTLLGIDANHVGDARFLDQAGALAAISATNKSFGCTTATSAAAINCSIAAGATISDFAGNGLSTGGLLAGNFPAGPGNVAFPGKNANFGQILLLEPVGRSVYNAFQTSLKSNLHSPTRFVRNLNATVSYSLSRYKAPAVDGDFINTAPDQRNPGQFSGPNGLDRTHQLSAGVTMDMPFGTRVNVITHWYSALPQDVYYNSLGKAEDVFQFDYLGDGQATVNQPVPGSNVGSFGRDVKAGDLNNFLQTLSSKFGNQLTPAGQALIDAGLFTQAQLVSLCAVTPSLTGAAGCGPKFDLAPTGQVGNDAFFTFDLRLGWSIKPLRHKFERLTFEPQVAFFNLFNRQNYNGPDNLLHPTLDGSTGSINNTTRTTRSSNLIGLGSGVFGLGTPRSLEFGFKVNF